MALNASLNKYRTELSDTAARNIAHSRPSSTAPARTGTPKPTVITDNKRTHDAAFSTSHTSPTAGHAGREILSQVWYAVKHLKDKDFKPVAFDDLIGYLSLPIDAQKNIPNIKIALRNHERVEYLPKAESGNGKESFKYRPLHPVTNAEELKDYLARQPTAQGVTVRDLKDGWPDCTPAIDVLERSGHVLVLRHKKDNAARMVWADSPSYHILNPISHAPQKADADIAEIWAKTKLPASETEIRNELEKAGLTPTSQVKEVRRMDMKRKEKRRVNRKSGKTTNKHLMGILKDYTPR